MKQDWDHPDTADSGRTVPTYMVANKSRTDYAWDYPASRGKKLILSINGSRRAIDVMEIGDLVPFKFVVSELSIGERLKSSIILPHRVPKAPALSRWMCELNLVCKSFG